MIEITMKPGFMYLATTSAGTSQAGAQEIPMPNGGAPFTTTHQVRTQRSADGSIAGQKAGRPRATQEMRWQTMDCQTWWTLNAWLETNGPAFWCRYFDYNYGTWRTRQFYLQEVSCSPYRPGQKGSADAGKPLYLTNATLALYDLGDGS